MKRLNLFPDGKLQVSLLRLCYQVLERHPGLENMAVLAMQPRGVFLGRRVMQLLNSLAPDAVVPYGELDVTFFRDDFRRGGILQPNQTRIDFLIEDRHVLLVDDVLYTGRSTRAAMDAMLAYGRPRTVELMVLVDRIHRRELPVEAGYTGLKVDSIESERVVVSLREAGGNDEVWLVEKE